MKGAKERINHERGVQVRLAMKKATGVPKVSKHMSCWAGPQGKDGRLQNECITDTRLRVVLGFG